MDRTSWVAKSRAASLGLPLVESGVGEPMDASELFRDSYLPLVRTAALLVGDRETAEDIVQDVFTRMQGRWRQFDDRDHALGYVRAAVVNGSRSALRRRATAWSHVHNLKRLAGMVAHREPGDVGLTEDIANAVARLSRRQQEVVVLRYYGDVSVAEAAQILGISQSSVKTMTVRALRTLQQHLGEPYA